MIPKDGSWRDSWKEIATAYAVPKNYREALESPEAHLWKAAIEDEYKSLMENGTWELTDLPDNRKLVSNMWVFDIKPAPTLDGPPRQKARLVAKGCTQEFGVDFDETFAPVLKLPTLRTLFGLIAAYDLEVMQLDVKTAFLYGKLDHEIYMPQPEGFVVPGREHQVCKLVCLSQLMHVRTQSVYIS